VPDIYQIMEVMRHRYPFLLVDRVDEIELGKRATGIKNVTINEPFFQGHFPTHPIMPGVLIIEALAQLGALVLLLDKPGNTVLPYLAGIDGFRFRRPVTPGDQLHMEVEMVGIKGGIGKMKGRAMVDDALVAEGEIIFAIR